jgi:adenylate kinase family enzyme
VLGPRILILGSSGSGKSTLAFELARRSGLPLHHLDRLIWLSGWVLRDRVEADAEISALLQRPQWVLDGAFPRHLRESLPLADTVVFLDLPRWLCVARVAKRILTRYGEVLPDMADGCPERGDFTFLHWIWNWRNTHRPQFIEALKQRPDAIVLTSHREVRDWLAAQ